jgi:hypothetical protein
MASVATITAVALVGVAVLAVQANGSAPKVTNATAQEHPQGQPSANPSASGSHAPVAVDPLALPANSGTGKRIVYSLGGKRIWLVGTGNQVERTAQVVPGTESPSAGDYKVSSWRESSRGSDGTSVQYVVLFGQAADGTSFGFDAVYGLSGMPPAPTKATGAVRMTQEDALALWKFATTNSGTPVKVVS